MLIIAIGISCFVLCNAECQLMRCLKAAKSEICAAYTCPVAPEDPGDCFICASL